MALKSAVAAMLSTDGGGALAQAVTLSEFAALVRGATVLDNPPIPWRRAPENVQLPAVTGDINAYRVAEGGAKPVGKFSATLVKPTMRKIVADIVVTDDLVRMGNPVAQQMFATELAGALAAQTDQRALNPNYGDGMAAAGTGFSSTAATIAGFDSDIRHCLRVVGGSSGDGHGGGLRNAIWITSQGILSFMAMLRTTANEFAYPSLSLPRPTLAGLPVYVSAGADAGGSPLEGILSLCDPTQVIVAGGNGPMPLSIAKSASIELADNPATPNTSNVSLFQSNLVCLRAERYIGILPVSQYAICTIDNVDVNY